MAYYNSSGHHYRRSHKVKELNTFKELISKESREEAANFTSVLSQIYWEDRDETKEGMDVFSTLRE